MDEHETLIQTARTAQRIAPEKLRKAINKSIALHRSLLRYAHTMVTQMAYAALANGRYRSRNGWRVGC